MRHTTDRNPVSYTHLDVYKRQQRAHKDAKILADAQALAEKIANLPLVIAAKAEEGRIFGAITAADLAEALAAKGIEIDRKTCLLYTSRCV